MYVRVTRTKHLLTDGTIEKAAKRNQEKKANQNPGDTVFLIFLRGKMLRKRNVTEIFQRIMKL